jgi:hypothetical protein
MAGTTPGFDGRKDSRPPQPLPHRPDTLPSSVFGHMTHVLAHRTSASSPAPRAARPSAVTPRRPAVPAPHPPDSNTPSRLCTSRQTPPLTIPSGPISSQHEAHLRHPSRPRYFPIPLPGTSPRPHSPRSPLRALTPHPSLPPRVPHAPHPRPLLPTPILHQSYPHPNPIPPQITPDDLT